METRGKREEAPQELNVVEMKCLRSIFLKSGWLYCENKQRCADLMLEKERVKEKVEWILIGLVMVSSFVESIRLKGVRVECEEKGEYRHFFLYLKSCSGKMITMIIWFRGQI